MKLLSSVLFICLFASAYSQKVIPYDVRYDFWTIQNTFRLDTKGIPYEELEFSTDNGAISRNNSLFFYTPERTGESVIVIYRNEKNRKIFFDSLKINVKKIDVGQVSVLYKLGGPIPKKALVNYGALLAQIRTTENHMESIAIKSFTLLVTKANGENICVNNEGNRFSEQVKSAIDRSEPGDRITFTNMKVKGFDNSPIELKPVEYVIK